MRRGAARPRFDSASASAPLPVQPRRADRFEATAHGGHALADRADADTVAAVVTGSGAALPKTAKVEERLGPGR